MPEDLLNELTAALEANAGGEAEATPEPAPEPADQPERQEASGGDDAEPATPRPEGEELNVLRSLREKHGTELVDEIYRHTDAELKRGVTPKLQKLSEMEKQYEGIEAADAAFLRQVYQIQQYDPRRAAELLRQAAQHIEGPQAPAPAIEPEPEPEFATEVERRLWERAQALEQRIAQQDTWRNQEQQARNRAEIDAKFARIESEAGRQVPLEERRAVANWCVQNGKFDGQGNLLWAPDVEHAWKVLNFDKAQQSARNEAASVVERKAAITPGPSSATRGSAPPKKEPESLDEVIRAMYGDR